MANLVITSTTKTIKVDFGTLSSTGFLPVKGVWMKDYVIRFSLEHNNDFVKAQTVGEPEWQLSFDGVNGLQVDSVDGVVPTSNSDLYNKLDALIS